MTKESLDNVVISPIENGHKSGRQGEDVPRERKEADQKNKNYFLKNISAIAPIQKIPENDLFGAANLTDACGIGRHPFRL